MARHEQIEVMIRHDGTPVMVNCGSYFCGVKQLCDRCELEAARQYPQGWRHYPGDVCEHGTYVGGVGRDLLCPRCEYRESA